MRSGLGRWGVGIAVAAALAAPTATATTATATTAPATTATAPSRVLAASTSPIDTSSQAAVAQAYLNDYLPTQSVPVGWTGSVSGCRPGTTSAASKSATADAVNYFRRMAGLSTIRLDAALESAAQQSALLMLANNNLSHNPPRSWACWTQAGYDAAGRSNLALGSGQAGLGAAANAVTLYMDDSGGGAEQVGHRRWVMYPPATTMGSGSTGNSNALTVFGTTASSASNRNPAWVSWPTAGYFPAQLEPHGRWSLSGDAAWLYDFSAARVRVVDPAGVSLPVRLQTVADGYGHDTLVWDLGALPAATGTQVRTYTVTVMGIKRGSVTGLSHTYQVKFFDPTRFGPVPCSGASVAGRQLNVDVTCDGVADLFAVRDNGSLVFFPGSAAGPFGTAQTVATGWGDSIAIVTPGAQQRGEFPVLWRRTPDARLLAYQTSATTGGTVSLRYLGTVGARWSAITAMSAAGDVDGDGFGDVYGRTTAGDLWLYFGAANGGIKSQLQVGARWNQIDAIFGGFDVTGDGLNDVVARHAPTGNMLRYPSNSRGQLTGTGQVVGVRWNGLKPLTSTSAPVSKNRMVGRIADGRVFSYNFASTGRIQSGSQIGTGWQDIRLLW